MRAANLKFQELLKFAKISEEPNENDKNCKNSQKYRERLTKGLMMSEWLNKNGKSCKCYDY